MMRYHFDSASDVTDTPCIRNCCLDEKDICMGCYRSLEEILIWHKASGDEKKGIMALCEHRKQQLHRP